ncbi:MAG: 4Fe-4S binding protein [candidate division KSB1 bacterium]|nr:4Fe-4S binding protein [candidate division KSB1 bacterium]
MIRRGRPWIPALIVGFVLGGMQTAFADEFQELSDAEFGDFEQQVDTSTAGCAGDCAHDAGIPRGLRYTLIALGLTAAAGVAVRFSALRTLRPLFLLGAVIFFGFLNGGCPCMISSFQNSVLAGLGETVRWYQPLWFLGLIPLTYVFGRVWCGWVCHLGAVQEFLYRAPGVKRFQSSRIQRSLKIAQIVLFAALVTQLIITRTNEFIHYDPFKVIFNLMAGNTISLVLLALLLITSLFIYRPFCRGACPVGLVLGWIGKLPGALRLAAGADCTACKACSRQCKMLAIGVDIEMNCQECLMCGECLDHCRKGQYHFHENRKSLMTRIWLFVFFVPLLVQANDCNSELTAHFE